MSGHALVINSRSLQSQSGSVVDDQPFSPLIMTGLGCVREVDLRDRSSLHFSSPILVLESRT